MKTSGPILLALFLLFTASLEARAERQLQGDPEAVARVEMLLERLGGKAVWARTRTLPSGSGSTSAR